MPDIGEGYAERRDAALSDARTALDDVAIEMARGRYGAAAVMAGVLAKALDRASGEQRHGEMAREVRGG